MTSEKITIHNISQCLKIGKNKLNVGKLIGVMFLDLSKAFDSINHNLFVSKLETCGFRRISLQLQRNYLKNYKERVNLNMSLSEWETILTDFP